MTIKHKKHPDFQSPVVVFDPPLETDDAVYNMMDAEARHVWEQTRNPLYVMEAFFRRFNNMTVDRDPTPDIVSFPRWMVKPVAEWFEVYYSNLVLEGNIRASLDDCANIKKGHKKEFDPFRIKVDQVINEAYTLMFLFEIGRTAAIELAVDLLTERAEIDAGEGNELFSFAVTAGTVNGQPYAPVATWREEFFRLRRIDDPEAKANTLNVAFRRATGTGNDGGGLKSKSIIAINETGVFPIRLNELSSIEFRTVTSDITVTSHGHVTARESDGHDTLLIGVSCMSPLSAPQTDDNFLD